MSVALALKYALAAALGVITWALVALLCVAAWFVWKMDGPP